MGGFHNYMTAEERLQMLKYAEQYGINSAVEKYKCTMATIYRWKRKYDGTLESLEDKSSRPLTPHPNALTEKEISDIKENVIENPYITDGELVQILGTNRDRTVIRKYRDRIFGKVSYANKADVQTMFSSEDVKELNKKDLANDKTFEKFVYLIEINNSGIYIGKDRGDGYPSFLTVYYNMALKFKTLDEAKNFIGTIKNSSQFQLSVKEVKKEF